MGQLSWATSECTWQAALRKTLPFFPITFSPATKHLKSSWRLVCESRIQTAKPFANPNVGLPSTASVVFPNNETERKNLFNGDKHFPRKQDEAAEGDTIPSYHPSEMELSKHFHIQVHKKGLEVCYTQEKPNLVTARIRRQDVRLSDSSLSCPVAILS